MIVVAVIILAVCAVVILGVVFGDQSQVVSLSFYDAVSADVTSSQSFLIGVATGAVTLLALWLLFAALRRSRQKAAERRAMERRHSELQKEKAELEDKLGRDREPTDVTVVETDPTVQRQDNDPR